jgi:gluconokinase
MRSADARLRLRIKKFLLTKPNPERASSLDALFFYLHEKNILVFSYVIGIDIGTGSTKALAVNERGETVTSSQVHYDITSPRPGFCEQSPETVWSAFAACVRKITTELKSPPEAIVLSSAMHSVIPVDAEGKEIHPMIIWADNRSAAIAKKIYDSALGEILYEQNGTPLHAMTPLCKILWLKDNKPSVFNKAAKFISIKEYIWFRLFHDFQVDYSIASATGMMDIHTCQWSANALSLIDINETKLSTLVSTDYKRSNASADICSQLGILTRTVIVAGASDGCFANLGSFATEPGNAALTIGTSGAVRVASTRPIYNFKAMTFNYRLDSKTFICGGPTNNGGVALRWYVTNFLKLPLVTANDYNRVLDTINAAPPGSDGLIFLPYLFGERAPIWNSDASGVFFGIRNHHKQEHFTRAVVEGISLALYDIAENLMSGGSTIKQIHVSGGFVRSSAWLQILADIFNIKVCLLNSDDASALGAAFMGLTETGMVADLDSIKPKTIKEVLPRTAFNDVYQRNFEAYRKIYNCTKDLMI